MLEAITNFIDSNYNALYSNERIYAYEIRCGNFFKNLEIQALPLPWVLAVLLF